MWGKAISGGEPTVLCFGRRRPAIHEFPCSSQQAMDGRPSPAKTQQMRHRLYSDAYGLGPATHVSSCVPQQVVDGLRNKSGGAEPCQGTDLRSWRCGPGCQLLGTAALATGAQAACWPWITSFAMDACG